MTNHTTETILEIIQRNYDKFTGTNEAELHAAEEIARMIEMKQSQHPELEQASADERWAQVNATLLVNFLRLPEEHMRHLVESMMAKRPDIFKQP